MSQVGAGSRRICGMEMNSDTTKEFNDLRPLLFSIAYRMLGSVTEAEDVLQEAWVKWQGVKRSEVRSTKAFLSAITTRLCIDHLRSAQVRRETYVGPWLPEPLMTEVAPPASDQTELADSLSMAFLTLLELLTPPERAAFLLRDVFDYPYEEIGEILKKSEPACRQLIARARRHLDARRPRLEVSSQQRDQLTLEFLNACATGEIADLTKLLTDDVVLWSDGGGKAQAARKPIVGPEKVARFMIGVTQKTPADVVVEVREVNGAPALILRAEGRAQSVLTLDVAEGRIQGIRMVVNPDKLGHI
jgi:RNA polymerase sigma-70 factor, ECF subfamily